MRTKSVAMVISSALLCVARRRCATATARASGARIVGCSARRLFATAAALSAAPLSFGLGDVTPGLPSCPFENSGRMRGGHSRSMASSSPAGSSSAGQPLEIDQAYPGTALVRMRNCRERAKSLSEEELSSDWGSVRRKILWAGGLRDLPDARPGYGYTGHSFNDWNHCDLCTMLGDVSHNENKGQVSGIAMGNQLGPGIKIASIEELGPGGSWSTCLMGCNSDPPKDVAHVQFRSRIAFKLVWCPPDFQTFILVDDDGAFLAKGTPKGDGGMRMPALGERAYNYKMVAGSKYAKEADKHAEQYAKKMASDDNSPATREA